jgi:hypothetical protein
MKIIIIFCCVEKNKTFHTNKNTNACETEWESNMHIDRGKHTYTHTHTRTYIQYNFYTIVPQHINVSTFQRST